MRALAVDHGAARIGLAISDELGMFARPLTVVQNSHYSAKLVGGHNPAAINLKFHFLALFPGSPCCCLPSLLGYIAPDKRPFTEPHAHSFHRHLRNGDGERGVDDPCDGPHRYRKR